MERDWNHVWEFNPNFILGKVPVKIEQGRLGIIMDFSDGSACMFYHERECCEGVEIEDVNGDWEDLIGHPLLVAEERVSRERPEGLSEEDLSEEEWPAESETWTFYTFRSIGGSVDVRWYGHSNGYYSERVDFAISEGE